MIGSIDAKVNQAAAGKAGADEFFPKDVADQYRKALDMHAAKMRQFETGPQVGLFRKGGDGQASIQGAEIPGKFFNANRSQVEDIASFKRLIGDRQDLADEMKRYAVTQGYGTSNMAGDLTSNFVKWLEGRTGAVRGLFSEQEAATLKEVGKVVERSLAAENAGRVTGSDTAQKIKSLESLGWRDSPAVNALASRIPFVGKYAGDPAP